MPESDNPKIDESPAAAPVVKATRKNRPLKIVAIVIGAILGVPVVAALVMLALSVLWTSDPASHVPEGFKAYASVPSAGTFVRDALELKALDALLSTPELGQVRGLVRSLRSQPFLRSTAFSRISNMRVDAALYDGEAFVAVAKLGWRSAVARLIPLALKLAPGLFVKLPGLSYVDDAVSPRFEYEAGAVTLYARLYRDLLIVAPSVELLDKAAVTDGSGLERSVADALAVPGAVSLRFIADPSSIVAKAVSQGGPLGLLLSDIDFPTFAVVDLVLKDERIALSIRLPATTKDPGLAVLLGRRSETPSILSRLPESVSYFSLLSAGKPAQLWTAATAFLGPKASKAYGLADQGASAVLGMGLDGLLLSWMGDEIGVYGSSLGADPVFFAKIADEKARRAVFDAALSTIVAGRDASAVVGDTRVPRIVFPRFVMDFLETVGVRLVEPFYLVEDGFLYASSNAETLAACVAEARAGKLLVKTERWKDGSVGVSPESSASLFYSLDRSVPFFMRGSSGLSAALRLYGRGFAAVRLSKGQISLELSAVPASGPGSAMLPGYPLRAEGRIDGSPIVGRTALGVPMAFWTSGSRIVSVNLSSGARVESGLDGDAWIAVDEYDDRIRAVWAVSERGTVWRMDPSLSPLPGFPAVSGQAVSGPPAVSGDSLIVPVSSDPALLLVAPDGTTRFSGSMHARSRSRPAVASYAIAALPRSFESSLYLFDLEGAMLPGWPVALSGISSADPLFTGGDSLESGRVVAITEAGDLYAYARDATAAPGFPVALQGAFDAAPVWAPGWRALFVVSIDGVLWKISADGTVLGSVVLTRGSTRGAGLVAFDADGDGREELYVYGGGDALYAYSGDLSPIPGYPVPGSGRPSFIDVDGDGVLDLVVQGADYTLRAYSKR